jgi:hypothetical protein
MVIFTHLVTGKKCTNRTKKYQNWTKKHEKKQNFAKWPNNTPTFAYKICPFFPNYARLPELPEMLSS